MKKLIRISLALLALAALPYSSLALAGKGSLHFPKTEITENPGLAQKEMVAHFAFENRGAKPVRILEIKTDCGCCTTGDATKKVYAPGEKGEILVTFKFGAFTGLQRKGVVVSTDDPEQPFVPLSVIATLPDAVSLAKNTLLWDKNEPAAAKYLVVRANPATPVKDLLAKTNSRHLSVKVEKVAATEYRVHVIPDEKNRDVSATLKIEAKLEDSQEKVLSAFVRVR